MARRAVPLWPDDCQSNRANGANKEWPLKTNSPSDSAHAAAAWLKRLWPLIALLAAMALVFAMGWHRYLTFSALAENREALRAFMGANMCSAWSPLSCSMPPPWRCRCRVARCSPWLAASCSAGCWAASPPSSAQPSAPRSSFSLPGARSAKSSRRVPDPGCPAFARDSRKMPSAICCSCGWCRFFRFGSSISHPDCSASASPPMSLTTFIGIIPGTFAYSLAGSGLDSVIRAQQAAQQSCLAKMGPGGQESCPYMLDPGALLTPELVAGLVALGLVALIPVAVKWFRRPRA